ncbi:MAG: histidine phosphatase family protein [Burkholderiaceae bacterium]
MDLILWRHAEAFEHPEPLTGSPGDEADLQRHLTAKGEKQATRMAAWLDRQLPDGARVLCSPAVRCEQTAHALGRKLRFREELLPERDPQALLDLVQWPQGRSPAVLVGHQPALGQVVARLLGLEGGNCTIRKGAVWWLRHRERAGRGQTILVSVQSPELL